jgi:multicomponent K+:H+ antiporter subunit E
MKPPSRLRRMLHRLLPHPWLALWLWLAWLLLNQTLAPAHLLLGAALAFSLSRLGQVPQPARTAAGGALRRPRVAARLAWRVLRDIVVANLQVAMRIIGPGDALAPRFVWVPLDLKRPRAIGLLAGIVTMTPGTVSADLSDDHAWLLVHGLDVADPEALVAEIKERYETPIRELFE